MKTLHFITVASMLLFASLHGIQAAPKLIHAGPMIGHVSDSTASVWIRIKHGARITGTASQGDQAHPITHWQDLGVDCHVLGFSGLKAATETTATLRVERDGDSPEEVTVQFRTYPAPSETGHVRIAFGSCSKLSQYPKAPIYNTIAEENPDMMLFLGDNAYFIVADGSDRHFHTTGPIGDWIFPDSMRARHLVTRVHPDLQSMLRSVPCYGIWDDHDYGPNNADRTFELKEEALRVFKQMWANPAWGTRDTPGIFSSFRCGPAEVFLMDDRYYKYSPYEHKDVNRETGILWGESQLTWLLDGLKRSTAPVKVIANGTQVLCQDGRGEGHYMEALGELQRLTQFLSENEIGGVVFVSGDRHHSEAMQQAQADGTLLAEATSSPLEQNQTVGPLDRYHNNQIWGMRGNNFGLLTIDLPETNKGTISFETRTVVNEVPVVAGAPCRTTWTLNQLQYGIEDRGAPPQTWRALFNGEDLTGWEQRNGLARFRVKEGVIMGQTYEGSPNSFLCTNENFGNFELRFEVKVANALNSGVQIRSKSLTDFHNGRVHGPQVEIAANPGPAGYIYSEGTGRGWLSQKREKTDQFRNNEWNAYHIRAEGNRIRTWVNGHAIADVTDGESSKEGFIGLQVHSVPSGTEPLDVSWRNLYVRDLTP